MSRNEREDHPYYREAVALATMHGKERALALPFHRHLKVKLHIPQELNTDLLGTFSGERPRQGTPLETARKKARQGMQALGLPYGLASEGSFGPHRWIPLVAEHHELLIWIDDRRSFEVVEQQWSAKTNFESTVVREMEQLDAFLKRVGFPSHALLVRPHVAKRNPPPLWKGLCHFVSLEKAIREAADLSEDGAVQVETDMRAHMNPTRMQVLRQLGEEMAHRLHRRCPQCGTPGWGVVERIPGLPCSVCKTATQRIAVELEGCPICDYRERRGRRDGLLAASPAECPRCNP
jgi:hypothetical protein